MEMDGAGGNKAHLRGVQAIARCFGVRQSTVRKWRKAGAPIYFIGKSWQANYQDLWNWLKTGESSNYVNRS